MKYENPPKVRMALDVHPAARNWIDDPSRPLFVTEGVRKADAAVSQGLCCVALLGVWNWRGRNRKGGRVALPDWECVALNDRQVYVVFDSDVMQKPEVRKALARLKQFLEMRGSRVALIYLPAGVGDAKVGLDDYLAEHTVDDLLRLATTELRTPISPELREAVPAIVQPAEISAALTDVVTFLKTYVVYATPHQVVADALWVAHTHVMDAFDVTPYLSTTSAERQSGKSVAQSARERLVRKPWSIVRPSEAVVYRKIAAARPTVLLDEVDAIFKDRGPTYEGLRALLNAGNRRGVPVPRCVGDKHDVVEFDVFCPKSLAGIGTLPDTIADRSIPIRLRRATPAERRTIRRFRHREAEETARPIREALRRWAEHTVEQLRNSRPLIPDELDGRQADAWEPLLAIADMAGGDWPRRARAAALSLHAIRLDQDETSGTMVLAALREIFRERRSDRLPTADIVRCLVDRDDGPWAEWWGKAVAAGETRGPGHRLAKMLKPYGVRPRDVRTPEGTRMGYQLEDLVDAFGRYLPLPSAQEPDNPIVQTGPAFAASDALPAPNPGNAREPAPAQAGRVVGFPDTLEAGEEKVTWKG